MTHDTGANYSTLTEMIQYWAARKPQSPCHVSLDDNGVPLTTLSYRDLDRRARAVAARLQAIKPGRGRMLIVGLSGPEFLAAYFGCLYAGQVAVPIVCPTIDNIDQVDAILDHVVADADADCALLGSALVALMKTIGARLSALSRVPMIEVTSGLTDTGDDYRDVAVSPRSIAHIIYTSGSTGPSKGVVLDHHAVLHNLRYTAERWEYGVGDTHLTFGAPFHSAGLMVGYLMPIFAGGVSYSVRPEAFTADPLRFLSLIDVLRIRHTTFGDSTVDRFIHVLREGGGQGLNLTSWRTAVIGGEPLQHETLSIFEGLTKPLGFAANRVVTAYGMTEAAGLIATGTKGAQPTVLDIDLVALSHGRAKQISRHARTARAVISCGRASHDVRLAIVDPEHSVEVPDSIVGELCYSSPSLFSGYLGHPSTDFVSFRDLGDEERSGYFRSGDLAFTSGGEVFVLGRSKEAIRLDGMIYFPLDIELCVAGAHPALAGAPCMAFEASRGGARLVVCLETASSHDFQHSVIGKMVMENIQARFGIGNIDIVYVRPGGLPRVHTSAKKPRLKCRQQFISGELPTLEEAIG
jgi:acyl-CoA synthetase (AMP-forming)/AMP-acid ligase II